MQNTSPNNKTSIIVRTKDLVFAEIILLSVFLITVIGAILNSDIRLIEIAPLLIGPVLYTLLWRYQSIKHETSSQKQNLQSGASIMLFIWSLLEGIFILPISFFVFSESISQGFSIIRIFYIIPFLVTSLFLFYMFKSFARSMKIDVKKTSIK